MLTEEEKLNIISDAKGIGGRIVSDAQLFTLIDAIIAAYRDKLLADVELPEPVIRNMEPFCAPTGYTKDQLQHCIAAARLQGRNEGLEKAKEFFTNNDSVLFWGSQAASEIEALKGKS